MFDCTFSLKHKENQSLINKTHLETSFSLCSFFFKIFMLDGSIQTGLAIFNDNDLHRFKGQSAIQHKTTPDSSTDLLSASVNNRSTKSSIFTFQ